MKSRTINYCFYITLSSMHLNSTTNISSSSWIPKHLTWSESFSFESKLSHDFRRVLLNSSKSRITKIFAGNSSISSATRILHSGHLNSFLVSAMSFRHRLCTVCWQGNTLQLWSSCSRHTEHSSSSFSCTASITARTFENKRNLGDTPHRRTVFQFRAEVS